MTIVNIDEKLKKERIQIMKSLTHVDSISKRCVDRESHIDKNLIPLDKLMELFYSFEISLGNTEQPENSNYRLIPSCHFKVVSQMKEAIGERDPEKLKFLELGSGVGINLWLAKNIIGFGSVEGIEINSKFVDICRFLVPTAKIHQMDLRTPFDYSKYDVIFSYIPIRCDEYSPFRNKVDSMMKHDGIFIDFIR